jgi:hypothetical protein
MPITSDGVVPVSTGDLFAQSEIRFLGFLASKDEAEYSALSPDALPSRGHGLTLNGDVRPRTPTCTRTLSNNVEHHRMLSPVAKAHTHNCAFCEIKKRMRISTLVGEPVHRVCVLFADLQRAKGCHFPGARAYLVCFSHARADSLSAYRPAALDDYSQE